MTQWGLDTLFNPAKRHMDEEKRRLQSTREEVGDSSGGKRIDLESGKVTIQRGGKDEADDEPENDGTEESSAAVAAASEQSADDTGERPADEAVEQPIETAADRARARRARQRANGA
jgi:hypothetical protein